MESLTEELNSALSLEWGVDDEMPYVRATAALQSLVAVKGDTGPARFAIEKLEVRMQAEFDWYKNMVQRAWIKHVSDSVNHDVIDRITGIHDFLNGERDNLIEFRKHVDSLLAYFDSNTEPLTENIRNSIRELHAILAELDGVISIPLMQYQADVGRAPSMFDHAAKRASDLLEKEIKNYKDALVIAKAVFSDAPVHNRQLFDLYKKYRGSAEDFIDIEEFIVRKNQDPTFQLQESTIVVQVNSKKNTLNNSVAEDQTSMIRMLVQMLETIDTTFVESDELKEEDIQIFEQFLGQIDAESKADAIERLDRCFTVATDEESIDNSK